MKITSAILILLFLVPHALAFETDQYNLPVTPLSDIGEEVAEYAENKIRRAIEKINARIESGESCLKQRGDGCRDEASERRKLESLRRDETVVREVYRLLGGGIPPFTNSGSWMEKHKFRAQPARFKTSYRDSIYLTAPIDYLTISSTVRVYGVEFGTDKIAHFFQQGFSYYRIYEDAIAKGSSDSDATKRAVRSGRISENTYYGTLVGGVYSNADLAANFAGFRFYQNLTREVTIGDRKLPPILTKIDGRFTFNPEVDLRNSVLKPFISEHLNEALNPSVYFNVFGFRSFIRRVVRDRACPQWKARFPELSKDRLNAQTESLVDWYGFDYGAKRSDKRITIAGTCF